MAATISPLLLLVVVFVSHLEIILVQMTNLADLIARLFVFFLHACPSLCLLFIKSKLHSLLLEDLLFGLTGLWLWEILVELVGTQVVLIHI